MNSKTAKRIRRALGVGKQPNPLMNISVRRVYNRIKALWPSLTPELRRAAMLEIEANAEAQRDGR